MKARTKKKTTKKPAAVGGGKTVRRARRDVQPAQNGQVAQRGRKGLSQAEFGRHVDLSQQRVAQMIASGTISVMANGRIDPDIARIEYVRLIRRSPASEEVRRVAAARARHIEIQNEKQLGNLISLEDVDFGIAEIITVLCGELHGLAAGCTRDLALRVTIQDYVNHTIDSCKDRFDKLAADARAGQLDQEDDDDDEQGDD